MPLAARRSPLAARRSPLAARRSPLAALAGLLTSVGSVGCLSEPLTEDLAEARDGELDDSGDAVVVFESRTNRSLDGSEVPVSVTGEVTADILEQVARPWSYPDEPFVYQEEAWEHPLDDGGVEVGYRITRMTREAPDVVPQDESVRVDPMLLEVIAGSEDSTEIPVHVRLRDFPEWDVPPSPNGRLLAPEDIAAYSGRRETAIAARQELAEQMAVGISEAIEQAGGQVVAVHGSSGWVWARMPAWAVITLSERDDVDELHWPDRKVRATAWRQGDGRWATRMNSDIYLASGYDGEIANPERHPWPRLRVSVIEGAADPNTESGFEDEACAFYDGANCSGTTRIISRYKCDDGGANPCGFVGGFDEADETPHGTGVAAAVLGDYSDGQGCGKKLNDDVWVSGCHSTDWEDSATGMAPEAWLTYFAAQGSGWPGSNAERFGNAIARSYLLNDADVINASWGVAPECSIDPGGMIQDEVENAFDDGVLVVAGSGNVSGPTSACNIYTPAGLIKSLAVNAFNAASPSSCETDYHSWCLIDQVNSAMGGIDASVTGMPRPGAVSGNDIVGPNRVIRFTSDAGDFGEVSNFTLAQGTSYASPTIAGLAVLVKHRMLQFGNTWINSPGRLKTVMLAMTDRHFSVVPTSTLSSTVQLMSGGDDLFGFGRATLRRLHGSPEAPVSWSSLTWNTKTGIYTGFPLGGPLPNGVKLTKCVLQQHEDLSGTASVSIADFDLQIRVRQPVGGACSSSGVQIGATRFDNSYDAKSMVAIESSGSHPLPGNCIEVKIVPVSAGQVTSTNAVCYYSGVQDDE